MAPRTRRSGARRERLIRPFQTVLRGTALGRGHAADEDHKIACKLLKPRSKKLEMIAPLGQYHRAATSLQTQQHIVEDQVVARLVLGQRGIECRHLRRPLRFLVRPQKETGFSQAHFVAE